MPSALKDRLSFSRLLRRRETYRYQQLKHDCQEIRLVTVRAATESPKAEVYCTVAHVSLTSASSQYETISYVWGNASQKRHVCVDGQRLNVPASAQEVLRQMRFQDRPRTLWIDAICINQADTSEKTQQVALMADIYSNSKCNLVWLGRIEVNASKLSATFQSILADARSRTDDFERFYETLYDEQRNSKLSEHQMDAEIDYGSITAFFDCPWLSVAPRNVYSLPIS